MRFVWNICRCSAIFSMVQSVHKLSISYIYMLSFPKLCSSTRLLGLRNFSEKIGYAENCNCTVNSNSGTNLFDTSETDSEFNFLLHLLIFYFILVLFFNEETIKITKKKQNHHRVWINIILQINSNYSYNSLESHNHNVDHTIWTHEYKPATQIVTLVTCSNGSTRFPLNHERKRINEKWDTINLRYGNTADTAKIFFFILNRITL